MSLPKSYVDGFLVEWAEGEYKAQVKMLPARSKPMLSTGGYQSKNTADDPKFVAAKAQEIRDRLALTARKAPEVVVKITSSCKGMHQIGRHIDYISRKGQIEVEDQDGLLVSGKEELKALKNDWRDSGATIIGDVSSLRDTINVVFSMPAETDQVSLKRALRAFAQSEFNGHEYVFAYHTPSTDPDPDPPDHPHLHLCLKLEGDDGRRLNPRKADLKRWRDGFAASLREHGIEANSTTRLARLMRDRGPDRAEKSMLAEGRKRESGGISPDRISRAEKLEKDRLEYYYAATRTLAESEHPGDKELAVALAKTVTERLAKLQPIKIQSPKRQTEIDR